MTIPAGSGRHQMKASVRPTFQMPVTQVTSFQQLESRVFWINLADRAAKTFVQNFIVALGGGFIWPQISLPQIASVAGLAALITVLLVFVGMSLPTTQNPLIDIVERATKTFAGSLVASLSIYTGLAGISWHTALALAASTALTSVLTTVGSVQLTGSPSLVKG